MTRRLAWMLALALLGIGTPAAHAGDSESFGDCSYDAVSQETVTGTDRFAGAIYAVVGVVSPTGAVASAEVTCELRINGAVTFEATGSGTGVVAFAAPVEFTASVYDYVELCTKIDYTSDDTPTAHFCWTPGVWLPPNHWDEFIINLFDFLNDLLTVVERPVCDSLASQAPGYGPVQIEEDGDLYVDGWWVWDCPPYEV